MWEHNATFAATHLEVFKLSFRIGRIGNTINTIHDIARVLSTLPQSLVELTLVFDAPYSTAEELEKLSWREFDRVLSGRRNLRKLVLDVSCKDVMQTERELIQIFHTQLSDFRCILTIKFSPPS